MQPLRPSSTGGNTGARARSSTAQLESARSREARLRGAGGCGLPGAGGMPREALVSGLADRHMGFWQHSFFGSVFLEAI